MKNQIYLLFFLALPLTVISQTWNLLGPDTANISRIDFAVAGQCHVLCADDGFYLYHYGNNTYEYFTYGGLPVTGAAYYNNEKILITMGNGSYSDGIYTLDIDTHEFEVIEYLVWPSFLHYNELILDGYWVGSEWGGLFQSADGMVWDTIEIFNTFPCLSMASFGQHLVVHIISDLTNGYWSDDGGENWYPSEIAPGFSSMDFHYDGDLLGIFPGYSNSSGLWKSDDYGNSWAVEIYQDNLTCVCYDIFSEIMVGYDGEGLGIYSPGSGISMMVNNPPNQHINNIQVNPTMSAPAIFVSTDEGVYYSYDYYVGVEEISEKHSPLSISPNPAQTEVVINSEYEMNSIEVFDAKGNLWKNGQASGKDHQIQILELKRGVYFVKVETEKGTYTVKFIKD